MYTLVKRRTLHAWIALLAILFSAVAPSISHAYAAAAAGKPVEICTVDGVKMLISNQGDAKQSGLDPAMHGMEHCPYCMTHAASFALPPPAASAFAVLGGHDLFPALFYDAPQALFSWTAANPRGPPLSA